MSEPSIDGPNIVAILGTARPGNYTSMALALVTDEIGRHGRFSVDVIDPPGVNLPLPGSAPDSEEMRSLRETVGGATGLIFATPEYHGTYSSVAKLIIENLGFPSVLASKPVAMLGVAAGQIGAIKALEHLRGVLSHGGAIVLPGGVSVPGVQGVFDEDGQCTEPEVETLIRSVATSLIGYIERHVCPAVTLEEMMRRGPAHHWEPPAREMA